MTQCGLFRNWTLNFWNRTVLISNWIVLFLEPDSSFKAGPFFFGTRQEKRRTFCVKFQKRTVRFLKDLNESKTPTKPFLTSDKKEEEKKTVLKSGISDMIPEKKLY